MKIKHLFMAFTFVSGMALAQEVDTNKSNITFEISNMKMGSVDGTFTGMTGNFHFSEQQINHTKIDICIDPATVDTDSKKRDEHLKNEDFFDVTKYPEICFQSTSFEITNEGYLTKGQLEMHGVSKMVSIPLRKLDDHWEGSLELNRKDYNIGPKGTFMVGDEVVLKINCYIK